MLRGFRHLAVMIRMHGKQPQRKVPCRLHSALCISYKAHLLRRLAKVPKHWMWHNVT